MSTLATEDRINRARELGLPTNVEEAQPLLMADAGVISAAIMDTLDRDSIWDFDDKGILSESEATEERVKFVECVLTRILILQKPPFSLGIKLENFCDSHKRQRLPVPTTTTCADCMAERLEKKRINDPD